MVNETGNVTNDTLTAGEDITNLTAAGKTKRTAFGFESGVPPMIAVEGLTIRYGQVVAVNDVTFHVNPGERVGILGSNGAGKSSTLRAVGGVNPPTAGDLLIAGFNMSDPKEVDAARLVTGYCPDVGGLVRQASVREHIALALAMRGTLDAWPEAMELVERFNLLHVFDRITQGFSHGMSRRLSVLLAVLTSRKALILDEPFDGVDPLGVEATLAAVNTAAGNGLAVIVSTHLLDLIVASCDRVIVMADGEIVDHGPAEEFAGLVGKKRYSDLLHEIRDRKVIS